MLDVDVPVGADAGVVAALEQDRSVRVEPRVGGVGKQRDPVEDRRRLDAGRVEERRREVDVDNGIVHPHPRLDAGAADQQRDPRRPLVVAQLAPLDPVLAVEEAVVGGEDDQGVVELAGAAQRVDHLADTRRRRTAATRACSGNDGSSARIAIAADQRPLADAEGLVGGPALVEARRARQAAAVERVGVAGRRLRRDRAVARRLRVRVRAGGVRCRVGEVEEERRAVAGRPPRSPRPRGR